MNKEEIKDILDSFWYSRIGRDEAIDKLLNLHIVSERDIYSVSYYIDGRNYLVTTFPSKKQAEQWIIKQKDGVQYHISVTPFNVK